MKILVTGGAGFIGSALIRKILRDTDFTVVNLDKLTYAATPGALDGAEGDPRYRLVRADIADGTAVAAAFADTHPDAVVHLAAETHVDRSIDGPAAFIRTNIVGTFTLLEAASQYCAQLASGRRAAFRFVNVSTDEVFGSLGKDGRFAPDSPYRPNSPYAASKAGADHLARAWFHTYGLGVINTNSANNYGPFQFPEKLIPVIVASALAERPIPIYGNGGNVRDWLHVDDHAEGLLAALRHGRPGESYNFGGGTEKSNLEVARAVCRILDGLRPRAGGRRHEELIAFVEDRPGHDFRYALDASRTESEIGWRARRDFHQGLRETVQWYLDHEDWRARIAARVYDGARLGIARARNEG